MVQGPLESFSFFLMFMVLKCSKFPHNPLSTMSHTVCILQSQRLLYHPLEFGVHHEWVFDVVCKRCFFILHFNKTKYFGEIFSYHASYQQVSLNFGHVITLDNIPNLTQINLKTDLQHGMKLADGSGSRSEIVKMIVLFLQWEVLEEECNKNFDVGLDMLCVCLVFFRLRVGDGDYFVFAMQVHESLNGNI